MHVCMYVCITDAYRIIISCNTVVGFLTCLIIFLSVSCITLYQVWVFVLLL